MIKILSEELKECETMKGNKELILEIYYSIKGDTGKVLLRDYDASNKKQHKSYLKLIKEQIAKQYLELNQK